MLNEFEPNLDDRVNQNTQNNFTIDSVENFFSFGNYFCGCSKSNLDDDFSTGSYVDFENYGFEKNNDFSLFQTKTKKCKSEEQSKYCKCVFKPGTAENDNFCEIEDPNCCDFECESLCEMCTDSDYFFGEPYSQKM